MNNIDNEELPIGFTMELAYYMKKNPALQDSPPAAGCFQQLIPLRRSAILPGELFIL